MVSDSEFANANLQIVRTADGSDTIAFPEAAQHYHSTFGAITESKHIFIDAGLQYIIEQPDFQNNKESNTLEILEIGFGTGLNALLTLIQAEKTGILVHYTAIEPYPIEKPIWSALNYPSCLGSVDHLQAFHRLHEAEWGIQVPVSPHFTLRKIQTSVQKFSPAPLQYQLIYFDAFSPDAQPELWTEEIFGTLSKGMAIGGCLVTYSVKGLIVRALRANGFLTQKLSGPPGKRHILRALKAIQDTGDKKFSTMM